MIARSSAPPVRVAIAELWTQRPELLDAAALAQLAKDPAVTVRGAAIRAWAAAGRYGQITELMADPDPGVRREIARAFLHAPESSALEPLLLDPDEMVRATLFAVRLLRGDWHEQPVTVAISRAAAASGIRETVPLEALRTQALHAQDQSRRLAAGLALAVLDDEAAYAVARSDPQWAIREKVGRMLASWREPGDSARHSA
jgi:hypothetical protein